MKQRQRKTYMIDFRLVERIRRKAGAQARSESDVLNDLLWAGVLNGPNMHEKREFLRDFEKFSDIVKTFIDRAL